ncbi:BZ3500_MvSof-1268-A1-R1_Chr7-1g09460 [Microbotryum saponariae]|uniref:BZ3500_MvSof-1268-A1-R1_Chr7-1g09460 protein n=1 Tax=Microbotryum saponariae TaxID=289078 RepID=A0A2X0N859_9BASI|nr:BZ3501_MvSof-1269-A2-R1_Chr7-1g09165 [Microbotryum saponariae]SDA03492.1 BZ3500_MvSof-1268-A1-R1_Chr7-1g09460 [Microbotryum saponariae]
MPSLEHHTLSTTHLALSLLPYGLTFSSLLVKVPGESSSTSTVSEERDVLIGPRDLNDHVRSRVFLNQTVGRYANRLPSGRVEVDGYEGLVLDLERTEGKGELRLGKLFTEKEPSSSSTIYRHLSPDGADGFPGNLLIEAFVALSEPNEREGGAAGRLEVVLRAKIVEGGEGMKVDATPVNLTIHWGFGGFDGREEKDVKEYDLWIAVSLSFLAFGELVQGDRTPELHPNMLPTGKILQLSKEDPLNFSTSRKIGANFPENGIDHNLLFTSASPATPQVTLISPDGRLGLEFRTNQSSVQCYTAAGFNGVSPVKKELHDRKGEGRGYDQFGECSCSFLELQIEASSLLSVRSRFHTLGATFLEFHQPIATFLHQELKEIVGGDTVLRRGEAYENWCEVTIRTK